MQSPDHPELPFVESSGYTKGRPLGPPLWIVVHDMEEEETPDKAEAVANYFATGAGGRSVSSHYCADSTGVVQCVRLADTAWTVGNTPGNYRGLNWELAGFASQTREQWLDDYGRAMLSHVAPIMRADAQRFGIPLRTLTDDEVRAYKPGITSHWQMGRVFGGTDHTDPGKNFPWDHLLELLNGGSPTDEDDAMLWGKIKTNDTVYGGNRIICRIYRSWEHVKAAGGDNAIKTYPTLEEMFDEIGMLVSDAPPSGGGVTGLVPHTHDVPAGTTGPAKPTA